MCDDRLRDDDGGFRPPWELLSTDPDAFVASVVAAAPGPATAAALAAVDSAAVSPAGQLSLLEAWQALTAWAEAGGAAALVAVAGDTAVADSVANREAAMTQRSRLHEASLALNVSLSATCDRWQVAAALATQLPATRQALQAGQVSWWHARSVAKALDVITPGETAADTAAQVDRLAAARGPELTPPRLGRACRALVDRLDAEAASNRLAKAHAERRVERFSGDDGQACLALWGSVLDVQAMWQAVDKLAGPTEADDPRTLANRRFDAALALLIAADPGDDVTNEGVAPIAPRRRNPAPAAHVVIDLATLLGLADNPCELPGYGPIPAGTAREWLRNSQTWRRLVTDPVTGHLLDYGPLVRFPPPDLDRFVRARDAECRFPGCHVQARRSDLDHRPPWTGDDTGGSTSAAHLSALCRQHHLWVTHHGWACQRLPDGSLQFTSPTGRTYLGKSPPSIAGP